MAVDCDVAIIGGGFFGCCVALHMRREHGARVVVAERGDRLLGRASYGNQARVHHGYHYPRDFTTAFRSRVNFPRFVDRYRACIVDDFLKLYAVARRNSLVTAKHFERFMAEVGAPCRPAQGGRARMFSEALVAGVWETVEYAFDADVLAGMLAEDMRAAGVEVRLGTEVEGVEPGCGAVGLRLRGAGKEAGRLTARTAFNCTYARLTRLPGAPRVRARVKYEIAELALVEAPEALKGVGVTVMDGPFFSCMPFPARGLHSLSHVRYTPHFAWTDSDDPADPYAVLDGYHRRSHFSQMARDAARYLPALAEARHRGSLFEVKTILVANEANDGRPILLDGEPRPGGVVSVLGGKVDNVFDVLDAIDAKIACQHRDGPLDGRDPAP